MTQKERIAELISAYNGIIQTSQVIEAGVSKTVFYQYARENELEQLAHGVYATSDTWKDEMYLLYLRCNQAVFSHEAALYLHDLTDREPLTYPVTVKTGYNPSKLKADGIQVYTVKQELHGLGSIMLETPFGHFVPAYNMERTVCDVIRSRSSIETQTFQDALKQYVGRKDKNLRLLMEYAALFRVEKIVRQYMEVLL